MVPKNRNKVKNSSAFNLIKKDVAIKEQVKSEINWYKIVNLLMIIFFTVLGLAAYLLGEYFDRDLEVQKNEVVDYANKSVYTQQKESVLSRITLLNDRYALYDNVRGKNVNIGQVINDLQVLYSHLQIKRIDINYGSDSFLVDLIIPDNGYEGSINLLHQLQRNNVFSSYKVKSIRFTNVDNQSIAEIQLELSIENA